MLKGSDPKLDGWKKQAGEKCDDSQFWASSSSLLPPPSDREAGSQGAGAALSVNGLRLRHVTQQQSPSHNTESPGKWWQVLVKERKGRRNTQQQRHY